MQLFFNALKASWISRIQAADPDTCNWVQLPKIYLYKLDEHRLNFRFNFDESVIFDEVENIPCFYKQHLSTTTRHLQVINKNLRKVL